MTTILGMGTTSDPQWLPLYTRLRRPIENAQRAESAPQILAAVREMFAGLFPGAKLRSVSNTYNCVGLVFANRRTWVDPDQLPVIFGDEHYVRVAEAHPGDLVIYQNSQGDVCHVGVVLHRVVDTATGEWNLVVLSKWGGGGSTFIRQARYPISWATLRSIGARGEICEPVDYVWCCRASSGSGASQLGERRSDGITDHSLPTSRSDYRRYPCK